MFTISQTLNYIVLDKAELTRFDCDMYKHMLSCHLRSFKCWLKLMARTFTLLWVPQSSKIYLTLVKPIFKIIYYISNKQMSLNLFMLYLFEQEVRLR